MDRLPPAQSDLGQSGACTGNFWGANSVWLHLESAMTWRMRVITTPQGTGAPTNLWPLTDTEPMGLRNVTIGAAFTNGICAN